MRAHLQNAASQPQGKVDELLLAEPLPGVLRVLWATFRELSGARVPSMGLSPITYSEIAAWAQAHGARLNSWEIEMLRDMDSVTLSVFSKKRTV